jgi:hypothetical protein
MSESTPQMHSADNSKKLDRLIQLMEGQQDAPGVLGKLALHEEMLFGKKGGRGLVSKVDIMWRLHVWILCAVSGASGWLLKDLALKLKL